MNQLLVFNHHSLPLASKEQAKSFIPELLRICIRAHNLGLSTILIDESIDRNWFRLQLCERYYWQDWYKENDIGTQKDLIRTFRSIRTRQPFFSSEDIGEGLYAFEVRLNGCDKYSALYAAVWHESPVVSFPICKPWDSSPIQVDTNEVTTDGDLFSNKYYIVDFFSLSVLKYFEPQLMKIRSESLKSGKEVLKRKNEIYPFIDFCGLAIEQLSNWVYSVTLLEQIKESLTILNVFCEKWNNEELDHYSHSNLKKCGLNHDVSGESQTVLQNRVLRKKREFWLPNGRKVLFENHIKLTKGFRIHFFPHAGCKKIYIGYIGPHLQLK